MGLFRMTLSYDFVLQAKIKIRNKEYRVLKKITYQEVGIIGEDGLLGKI
jgi:hypothetical protein